MSDEDQDPADFSLEMQLLRLSVYRPNPVSVEPDAVLLGWRVYELDIPNLDASTRHFVGFNTITGDGRVSSPITSWDPVTRTGVTRSGRRYHLHDDDPGFNMDAQHVFERWLQVNGVEQGLERDVSAEYLGTVSS